MDILADTNILLRRIHRGDPQHRITQRCLNRLIKEGNRICVTSQNLIYQKHPDLYNSKPMRHGAF